MNLQLAGMGWWYEEIWEKRVRRASVWRLDTESCGRITGISCETMGAYQWGFMAESSSGAALGLGLSRKVKCPEG